MNSSRCFNCGKTGHISKHCDSKEKGPKCYHCQEFGHVSPQCPNKDKLNKPNDSKKVLVAKNIVEHDGDLKLIEVNGITVYALIDTGSDYNMMTFGKYRSLEHDKLVEQPEKFDGVGSKGQMTMGKFECSVTIDGEKYETIFHVVSDDKLPVDCIVGKALIKQTITVITPEQIKMVKYEPENLCKLEDKLPNEKVENEQESDERANASLGIIDNLNDTDKSDEKMNEDEADYEVVEKLEVVGEDEMDEDDVLGEPLTFEDEEYGEEEDDDEPEESGTRRQSGSAILIDDDEPNEEIDEDDVKDEGDIDEEVIEEDYAEGDDGEVDNEEEDDDIKEIIEYEDDEDDSSHNNSEPEEIRDNIKFNSSKGVNKRFGPKFKMKRLHNFFAHLKRRTIKWLTKIRIRKAVIHPGRMKDQDDRVEW